MDRLINKIPELLSTQDIIIKSNIESSFRTNAKLFDPVNNQTNAHKILVLADGCFVAKMERMELGLTPEEIMFTYMIRVHY